MEKSQAAGHIKCSCIAKCIRLRCHEQQDMRSGGCPRKHHDSSTVVRGHSKITVAASLPRGHFYELFCASCLGVVKQVVSRPVSSVHKRGECSTAV